jgi:hypothetical protein
MAKFTLKKHKPTFRVEIRKKKQNAHEGKKKKLQYAKQSILRSKISSNQMEDENVSQNETKS